MKTKYFLLFLFLFLSIGLSLGSDKKISLKDALLLAEKENGEIKTQAFDIDKAALNIDLVKSKYNPKLDIMTGIGPINKAYGDAINSENSDVTEVKNWRALYVLSARGSYPLYSWGQKSDYLEAAKLNKEINEDNLHVKKSEIRFKVKELYYSNLLIANLLDFTKSGIEDIVKAKEKIKNKDDIYRLEIFENLIRSKEEELIAQYKISIKGLNYYLAGENLSPQEEWLDLEERELLPLESYLKILGNDGKQLIQIEKGIEAKNLLAKATEKSNYPILGLLLKYEYAHTNARQVQKSVFAYDPYNESSLIVGIGFNWNIDFGVSSTQAQEHRVDSLKLQTQKVFAEKGLALLVEKSWEEVKSLEKRLKVSGEASKMAKKLLSRSLIGGSMGLVNAKDIVDSYEARVLSLKEHFQTIYDYNLAWAHLSLAIGKEVDPLLTESEAN